MARRIIKIAAKSFLIWVCFFMAVWVQADEIETIKNGHNSYWSNIKDGKGSCAVLRQNFSPNNPAVPQSEIKDSFEWVFAGPKIRCKKMNVSMTINGQKAWSAREESVTEIYFDGQGITAGGGKTFVLRKPTYSDFGITNEWDPRLVVTGSTRSGESWEPVTFWDFQGKGNYSVIGKEKINGYECYVLETTIEKDLEKNGGMIRRNWFDIERNYCLVRSEIWFSVGKDQVIPKGQEWTKDVGKYLSSRTDIELKKYGKELWGPKKYEWVQYAPDSKTKTFYVLNKTTKIYDEVCAYNLGLTENELKISIPPDATIFDASKYPTDYVKPKVSIEFRTTKNISSPNFTPVNTPDTNEKVYISDKAEMTEADIIDHTRTLLRKMGLAAVFAKPNLSRPKPEYKIYPYLLSGMAITRPNQVWSADITYIRLDYGFAYLVAVLDWYSRYVLSWRLSNTLDALFCVEALKESLVLYGQPEIFNTDQGSQFTGREFTGTLAQHSITISMDGKGRAFDNIFVERLWRTVKYENVYLYGYQNIPEAREGLRRYFEFYNRERFHQRLDYKTPWQVYSEKEAARMDINKQCPSP